MGTQLIEPVAGGVFPDGFVPSRSAFLDVMLDFGAKGDGVTDDTGAFVAALLSQKGNGLPIWIPEGGFRITSQLLYQTMGDTDGLKMLGAGWYKSILLFDFADGTPLLKIDGATLQLSHFQWYGYVKGFQIRPAVGRTAVRSQGAGLSLTGAFGLEIDLFLNGIHGDGVVSPLRNDISPNNGDPYASVYLDFCSTRVEGCDGIGINGASGIGCSSVRLPRVRIGKNRQQGIVLGGHNWNVDDACSIFSNGYDADFYSNAVVGANGTTVTASQNYLGDAAPPFTNADIGKTISGHGFTPGTTIASINSTTSFEASAASTVGATSLYVQRTGLLYPGVHCQKIIGEAVGLRVGQCELDGNKVANMKFEGAATAVMIAPRLISHESTFNDGELSPPIHVLFANALAGAKNTQIQIVSPYHRSEDTGAGRTLTLYDLGNNANNNDIGIERANLPSTDNVPAAQITQIANKNNTCRVDAVINSKRVSSAQEWPQLDYRWSAGRADAACSTQTSTTVLDAAAVAVDVGKSISSSDGGIPANATITVVQVGVGYTISAAATTTASGLTFTVGATVSSTTNTVIAFNSVNLDPDSLYAGGVFTAPYRGEFEVTVDIALTAPAAGRRLRLYANKATPPGAYAIAQQFTDYAQGAAGNQTFSWTTRVLLAAGDTLTIGADNNSGAPHAVQLNTTESKLSIMAL